MKPNSQLVKVIMWTPVAGFVLGLLLVVFSFGAGVAGIMGHQGGQKAFHSSTDAFSLVFLGSIAWALLISLPFAYYQAEYNPIMWKSVKAPCVTIVAILLYFGWFALSGVLEAYFK